MRAHYLQHVPFEGPGMIGPWLRDKGYALTKTLLYESAVFPGPGELDVLVVMGGPMSVNDEAEFPWLMEEKRFIRRCVEDEETAVLGICLGAQLIASALGARVYPNRVKEIGWYPIEGIPSPDDRVFSFPRSQDVFHWHGETFDLPSGSHHLARSDACENQAFQIGRYTIGLQFHLETSPETAREIVHHCRAELTPSRYVQSQAAILAAQPDKYHAVNNLMAEILSHICNP